MKSKNFLVKELVIREVGGGALSGYSNSGLLTAIVGIMPDLDMDISCSS